MTHEEAKRAEAGRELVRARRHNQRVMDQLEQEQRFNDAWGDAR